MAHHGEDEPASLRRSRADTMFRAEGAIAELIGHGPLWKMVRAATTDPDGELWRYSIIVGDTHYKGDQIRSALLR